MERQYSCERKSTAVVMWFYLACGATAWGQPLNVVDEARAAALNGSRAEALARLEVHLNTSPRDVDARLLYGIVLSWEGQYSEARRELTLVLDEAPTYNDARIALANIAWWEGHYADLKQLAGIGRAQRPDDVEWMLQDARALEGLGRPHEAREVVKALLARAPGHPQARSLKNRLDSSLRPWSLTLGYSADGFSDGRTAWDEFTLSLGRQTPVGSVILSTSEVERFGLSDRIFEVEMYPTFRPGTYAFVSIGITGDEVLYPAYRVATDLYQSVGNGFEVSGGFRRLGFSTTTDIYLGTLTKYLGNWMATGKAYYLPDSDRREESMSFHGLVRRYVRDDGESFVGAGYSHGSSREELDDRAEFDEPGADTVRADADILLNPRLLLSVSGSSSRQARAERSVLWQYSLRTWLTVRF